LSCIYKKNCLVQMSSEKKTPTCTHIGNNSEKQRVSGDKSRKTSPMAKHMSHRLWRKIGVGRTLPLVTTHLGWGRWSGVPPPSCWSCLDPINPSRGTVGPRAFAGSKDAGRSPCRRAAVASRSGRFLGGRLPRPARGRRVVGKHRLSLGDGLGHLF